VSAIKNGGMTVRISR